MEMHAASHDTYVDLVIFDEVLFYGALFVSSRARAFERGGARKPTRRDVSQ